MSSAIRRGCLAAAISTLLMVQGPPIRAESASFTDPDDVNLPLDLKTLSHENDASTVTYTVETYEAFKDTDADFRWGIDKNNDKKVDNFVSVEFDGQLLATVEDADENQIGHATVTRVGPASLRVTFSRDVLGGVASYGYQVRALSDKNGNGEADPGETDMAPDTGFYQHRL